MPLPPAPPDPAPSLGSAADFWSQHVESLFAHEWALYVAQETRAQNLAGALGLVLAAGAAVGADWRGGVTDGVAVAVGGLGWLLVAAATLVFWMTLTPLEGKQFREGSLAGWLQRHLVGDPAVGLAPGALGRALRTAHSPRLRARLRADLVNRLRDAAADQGGGVAASPAALALLNRAVQDDLKADVSFWLEFDGQDTAARAIAETRIRRYLRLWALRQAVQAKADLVQGGLSLGALGVPLVLLGAVVHATGLVALVALVLGLPWLLPNGILWRALARGTSTRGPAGPTGGGSGTEG